LSIEEQAMVNIMRILEPYLSYSFMHINDLDNIHTQVRATIMDLSRVLCEKLDAKAQQESVVKETEEDHDTDF
jgi:hypothetical protein